MKKVRGRTKTGRFTVKRDNTSVGAIEKKYNVDLGVRSDMKLSTYLKQSGYDSLSKLLNGRKR